MTANITDFIAYASLRGTAVLDDAASASALVRGTDYIRLRYTLPLGLSIDAENSIEAIYIASGYEITTPGFWSTTFTPAQQKVLTGVGNIRWTVSDNADMDKGYNSQLPVSPAIDALFGGTSNSGLFLGVFGATG